MDKKQVTTTAKSASRISLLERRDENPEWNKDWKLSQKAKMIGLEKLKLARAILHAIDQPDDYKKAA